MKNRLTIWTRFRLVIGRVEQLVTDYSNAIMLELRRRPRPACGRSVIARIFGVFRARLRYGLGPFYYSLYQLSDVPVAEWPDYLTDSKEFNQKLKGMSPPDIVRIGINKAVMYEHCLTHDLAAIPILCIVGDSPDPLRGLVPVVDSLDAWRRAMKYSSGALFVKEVAGSYGEGAFLVRSTENGFEFDGRLGSLDDLYYYIERKCKTGNGWIVQPWVEPHAGLLGYVSPNALPTIRAITAMAAGQPKLLFAMFKITVGNNTTDNFSQGASGNLVAAIDPASGRLACPWGSLRADWPDMASFRVHPDSQMAIEGEVLPCWREVVTLATAAQASVPTFKSVGWDIVIRDNGPALLEANVNYGVYGIQVAYQRGLRRELHEALSW